MMRLPVRSMLFRAALLVAVAAASPLAFAQSAPAKAEGRAIPRAAEGKPDFTGFFNIQYTPNMSFGKEDGVPYTDRGPGSL